MRNIYWLLLSIVVTALAAIAQAQQPTRVPRLGFLSPFSPHDTAHWHEAFRQGLRDHGWLEGKNIAIEYRYAEGKSERLVELAADLVRLKVDIIVASVGTDALAAKNATREIPIVVASAGDAVASGLVQSLARPGGNLTGLTQIAAELTGKRLELLKEIVPRTSRMAVLWNPQGETSKLSWLETQQTAREFGIQLHSLEVKTAKDFDHAFKEISRAQVNALIITPHPVFANNLKRIADFAVTSRLPSVFHLKEFVESGGLMAYGPDRADLFRRAATYVDKILKGRKPADLPVEQPMKFELVINLKTAKQIGLTIPPNVLARADKVIR